MMAVCQEAGFLGIQGCLPTYLPYMVFGWEAVLCNFFSLVWEYLMGNFDGLLQVSYATSGGVKIVS